MSIWCNLNALWMEFWGRRNVNIEYGAIIWSTIWYSSLCGADSIETQCLAHSRSRLFIAVVEVFCSDILSAKYLSLIYGQMHMVQGPWSRSLGVTLGMLSQIFFILENFTRSKIRHEFQLELLLWIALSVSLRIFTIYEYEYTRGGVALGKRNINWVKQRRWHPTAELFWRVSSAIIHSNFFFASHPAQSKRAMHLIYIIIGLIFSGHQQLKLYMYFSSIQRTVVFITLDGFQSFNSYVVHDEWFSRLRKSVSKMNGKFQ